MEFSRRSDKKLTNFTIITFRGPTLLPRVLTGALRDFRRWPDSDGRLASTIGGSLGVSGPTVVVPEQRIDNSKSNLLRIDRGHNGPAGEGARTARQPGRRHKGASYTRQSGQDTARGAAK